MIIDIGCFLGYVDIDFFIIGQGQEKFCLEHIGFMQHFFIEGISLQDDYAFLPKVANAAMFGIWFDDDYFKVLGVFDVILDQQLCLSA